MEKIKQAVDRAKASATGEHLHPISADDALLQSTVIASQGTAAKSGSVASKPGRALRPNEVRLDWSHLEQHRIVGQNVADPRSKVFDVLRTQVLQAMDQKNWKFLAVTSPTEGCGKTVTAVNLALSIARQPERSALLVDMDLQRPAVADYLGIKCRQGVQDILERRAALTDLIVRANADICELLVLPATAPTIRSSELIASPNLDAMLRDIKEYFSSCTVIVDMPPLLQGDEVIATLPRIDAVLLVTAVGVSTLHEIKECNKHLQMTEVLRVVLNKSHEVTRRHYY